MQNNIFSIIDLVIAGIAFYVFTYHLVMYIKRPASKVNLAFAISALSFSIYNFLNVLIFTANTVTKGAFWYHIQIPIADIVVLGLLWFIYYYSENKSIKITLFFTTIFTILFLLTFILWNTEYTIKLDNTFPIKVSFFNIYQITVYQATNGIIIIIQFIFFILCLGYITTNAIKKLIKTKELKDFILLFGFVFLFIGVINDILVTEQIYSSIFLVPLAYFIIIYGVAYILQDNFITLHKNVEDLNRTLDFKVKEKTKKLNNNVKKLQAALSKLKTTQNQLVHSEKMASIGQLAAGVAHEINNPVGYIKSNIEVLDQYISSIFKIINELDNWKKYNTKDKFKTLITKLISKKEEENIDYIKKDIIELVKETIEGVNQINKIVSNLKHFAHPATEDYQNTNLNKLIEQSLNLLKNEIKYIGKVLKELHDIPDVSCNKSQINQVFVNLLINSIQAIEIKKESIIKIKSYKKAKTIHIEFHDNGIGIEKKHLSKIFDPFFTTKEVGKGTGLGLSLVYGIIKDHKWYINVKSKVNKGTTFTISIPVKK